VVSLRLPYSYIVPIESLYKIVTPLVARGQTLSDQISQFSIYRDRDLLSPSNQTVRLNDQLNLDIHWGSKDIIDRLIPKKDWFQSQLGPEPHISLEECLKNYFEIEKLDSSNTWNCPKCKSPQQATKKFDLWTCPKYLIIHLKRFRWVGAFQRTKITTPVDYPLFDLDLSKYIISPNNQPVKYDLYAVCIHKGGLNAGHYIAIASNHLQNRWYCFNDDIVEVSSPDAVNNNPDAYVLFYKKSDTMQE